MTPPLHVSWISWFSVAANFLACFFNTFMALKLRRRIKDWERTRADWDKSVEPLRAHAEAHEKLLFFAIMIANAPDDVIVDAALRAHARGLIPPDVKYEVNIEPAAPKEVVH